ncbi:MAG: hypothetical protein KatS3mg108_2118 [Isosphaeraceae bacterium]|jgi:hypothetical protein|nr:MAG: hypothetical protein KatS3mg108_2118 [Isosphaeraceae bacterium]
MTFEKLQQCNKKELARMARDQGIVGWHAMRKDQLIRALTPARKGKAAPPAPAPFKPQPAPPRPATSPTRSAQRPSRSAASAAPKRVLEPPSSPARLSHSCEKDRIITMVRDPYWLHTYWELSRSTLARAQAALGQEWHAARPILRLMDVSSEDTTPASECHVRDIPIHGGVSNWYIDVNAPLHSFRVDIGYLSPRGKFYVLARSNVVTMPKAGASDMFEQNWLTIEKDCERIFHQSGGNDPAGMHSALRELFEEKMRRPMNSASLPFLNGPLLNLPGRSFHFELDAELVVYGATEPTAKVTLQGEPVPLRPDGTFSVRFALPEARQIIPAVAASADGVEERTIVLAVERNTKELEPMIHDGNEL